MRFEYIQQSFFWAALIISTIAFLFVIHSFLFPIFWAIVFAVLFTRPERFIRKHLWGHATLSTLITMVLIVLIIIIPVIFLGNLVIAEALTYYQKLAVSERANIDIIGDLGTLTRFLEPFGFERLGITQDDVTARIFSFAQTGSQWVAGNALAIGQNAFRFALGIFVMLYVLFFMLRDGTKLEERIIKILPIGDQKERRIFSRFASVTRATIKGNFIIAIIQGAIGGALFFAVGIDAALLWALLMAVLSVIPALGAGMVWFPVGIILLLSGSFIQGLAVLAGGFFVISLIDNFLRPVLVGRDTQMPDVFILLSTLGGLSLFGVSGFILGPIVAGLFMVMWQMFEEEYSTELKTRG